MKSESHKRLLYSDKPPLVGMSSSDKWNEKTLTLGQAMAHRHKIVAF